MIFTVLRCTWVSRYAFQSRVLSLLLFDVFARLNLGLIIVRFFHVYFFLLLHIYEFPLLGVFLWCFIKKKVFA